MVDNAATPAQPAPTGAWVAVLDGITAASGDTAGNARRALPPEKRAAATLHYVEAPGGDPLLLPPLLEELTPLLAEHRHPVYLVGGTVRDALLRRESKDLDFAVAGRAVKLAFRAADALGAPAYILDKKRDVGRIVLQDTVVDLALLRGADLAADLGARDFTINAMALPVGAVTSAGIVDPTGGRRDLAAGLIRLAGPTSLADDPLRCIRAVRFAASLGFAIVPETATAVRAASETLSRVSPERIRDELLKLLGGPAPGAALLQLAEFQLLPVVLPEASALSGLPQSAPHRFDALAHTARTLDWLARLEQIWLAGEAGELGDVAQRLAPFAPQLRAHALRIEEGAISGRTLLRLGALAHDWGKPAAHIVAETGRHRFLGHEAAGAPLANQRLKELKLSNRAVDLVATMVRHHMRPLHLAGAARLTRRAVYRYYRATGDAGIDVVLLALADHLGTYDGRGDADAWARLLAVVEALLAQRFSAYETVVKPPPLLSGYDLMRELGLPAGREIGRLLAALEEAQAVGEVADRAAALALARRLQET